MTQARKIEKALGPLVWLALALAASACAKNEHCTKARLDASDTWKRVMESAAKNKLGGPGYDDLDERKKGEHYKAWNKVETESEMVFKSFAYEKITWNTAKPAREKANSEFESYFGRDQYKGFATSLEAANQSFKSVEASCPR
jgi:leucyl aminopeptidase (aminopeptidase T)